MAAGHPVAPGPLPHRRTGHPPGPVTVATPVTACPPEPGELFPTGPGG